MPRRTITLREDVYEELEAERRPDESVSDVLARLLGHDGEVQSPPSEYEEHPLELITGILDEEGTERVRERAESFRASLDEQMERHSLDDS